MKKLYFIIILFFTGYIGQGQTINGLTGNISNNNDTTYFDCVVTGLSPANLDTFTLGLESVCITIAHPISNELNIYLKAPDGTIVILSTGNGDFGANYTNTCFRDDMDRPITYPLSPLNGTYIPESSLWAVNNGQNGNGTWQLLIHDSDNSVNAGSLIEWRLRFGNGFDRTVNFISSDLPIVVINTNGQVIPNEPKIEVDMGIIYNGAGVTNAITDPYNHYNGKALIELRGSTSFNHSPKKSYAFKFVDPALNDSNVSMFGMPAEHDWLLIASYNDKSFLRHTLTYELSRQMGHYAPRSHYCEVILDGEYMGLYIFMERIKRDSSRVDIAKLNPGDTTGTELTGGYIFRIDKNLWPFNPGWTSPHPPANNILNQIIYFQYYYPKHDVIQPQQKIYIENYVTDFENALAAPTFTDPIVGYRPFIDTVSFMDYFILQELSKNVDGYRLSAYMHKEKVTNGGKLKMGPVWDFDIAYNNVFFCDGNSTAGWQYPFAACEWGEWQPPFWWERFMEDTTYVNSLKCRWLTLRSNVLEYNNIVNYISSVETTINQSKYRNFKRWPILGIAAFPNPPFAPTDFAGEIQRVKDWLQFRLAWIDQNLPGTCYNLTVDNNDANIEKFINIYPNPFENFINLDLFFEPYTDVDLAVFSVLGQQVVVQKQKKQHGQTTMAINLEDIKPGIYFLRVKINDQIITRKIIRN